MAIVTQPTARPSLAERLPPASMLVQYGILMFIVVSALAGSFTHMHDWTVRSLDDALAAMHVDRRTPGWIGWANAVISELTPVSAFLSMRARKGAGRSTSLPSWIFAGSIVVSLTAQLSATGVDIPYAAQFLACLPAFAVLVLSHVIFGDIEHAELARERAAELARKKARTLARRAAHAAELDRRRQAEAAELAAELDRRERAEAAELAARLERERVAAEQAGLTERARIEAAERAAEADHERGEREREAARRHALDVDARRIEAEGRAEAARVKAEAEAALVRAEAERVEAEAEATRRAAEAEAQARRAAADRVAAARHAERPAEPGGNDDAATTTRRRRPRAETAALVDDALVALPAGTTREAAVEHVAAELDITPRYAREFVPEGWVAGPPAASSASPRRHLAVVGAGNSA